MSLTLASETLLDAKQAPVVSEEVHPAAQFTRKGLGVPKRYLALGRVSQMRDDEVASDPLLADKANPGAVARRLRQEDTKIELEALRLRFAHQRAAIARRAAASVTL